MSCALCGGNRYVFVLDGYVDQQAPLPVHELGQSDEEFSALHAEAVAKRSALSNTVYPCRECAPAAFMRWAGGHLDPGHEAGACDECRRANAPRHGGGSRRRGRGADPLPEPPGDLLEHDHEPPSSDWGHTRKDLE